MPGLEATCDEPLLYLKRPALDYRGARHRRATQPLLHIAWPGSAPHRGAGTGMEENRHFSSGSESPSCQHRPHGLFHRLRPRVPGARWTRTHRSRANGRHSDSVRRPSCRSGRMVCRSSSDHNRDGGDQPGRGNGTPEFGWRDPIGPSQPSRAQAARAECQSHSAHRRHGPLRQYHHRLRLISGKVTTSSSSDRVTRSHGSEEIVAGA